ncbi:major capsid protein [Petroclostridium sp. X23]|uniref:major capsid protein n=1 Tax=Petroclostridium sp. X23 TaxID=3045146 RepID=UPI0024AE1F89|nr:phage capsid protein [Petroclostridium sp. X23]WHH58479.1 phage capsid protein [Petroclostridium sp. X23]
MITLAQAKVGMSDKVDQQVIDIFRRESILLDQLVFDDAVSPGTGGSTLTYGYVRMKTPATAGFRAINTEYTAQVADREKFTVDLKIFGGAFEIDRVIADTSGAVDEVDFQLQEKIKAARNLFHYTVINGDSAVDSLAFDGLDKALINSSTEKNTESYIDLSDSAAVDTNYKIFLDLLDDFLSDLNGKPNFLMGNSKLMTRIKAVARRAGYLTASEDAFGRKVDSYDGIPLLDLGYFTDISEGTPVETPVVPIVGRTIGENPLTGLTDLYAPVINLAGFHGVTVTGNSIIRTFLPDFNIPGAVKKGEVEMIGAVALKNTRAAGVLRNIKVQ